MKARDEQAPLKVLKTQSGKLKQNAKNLGDLENKISKAITEAESLLRKYESSTSVKLVPVSVKQPQPLDLRSWEEIVEEAEGAISGPAEITDLLTPEEVNQVKHKLALLKCDFDEVQRLDKLDWAICGVSGTLAALTDIFLVKMPRVPGFFGRDPIPGGPLSEWVKNSINSQFKTEKIAELEKSNWVPYDYPSSRHLEQAVEGLGPGSHRFQSLGHDPILGFFFGVKDILNKTFTAIDKNGKIIIQNVNVSDPAIQGMGIFAAIGRVFGHMKSDIATERGLPVPLMPLLQLVQVGSFGRKNYTVGEMSRIMYRSGYDFRHFLTMSIPVLLVEVLVRTGYFFKRLQEGHDINECIPFNPPTLIGDKRPKLQTMLFSAHLVSTAANAGKLAIGQNPLLLNYPQWLAFFKYFYAQLKWTLLEKDYQRNKYLQDILDADWEIIHNELDKTWNFGS